MVELLTVGLIIDLNFLSTLHNFRILTVLADFVAGDSLTFVFYETDYFFSICSRSFNPAWTRFGDS